MSKSTLFLLVAVLLGSSSAVHAATATWSANPEPDVTGYILSYGTQPGVHPTSIDVGDVTTWQINTLSPGQTYYFVVQAYDSSGLTSDPSAEVAFTDPTATPPTLAQPANQTSAENSSVSLQLVGSNPDGDTLTYSATGLPASLSLNAATGLISGTLPFGSAGTYAVTATVSDGSQTSSKSFTWTVTSANQGPTITSLSRTAGPVGTPLTISGANFGATQGTSTVTFNGTAATPSSWSTASITLPVPSGATTGPVVVTVNSEASNGVSFTVTAATSAITLTQHGDIDAGTTTTASLTFGAANTAGNFIAVAIRAGLPNQTFTVTDSGGNSYQKAIEINNGSDDTLAVYYAQNIAGGTNTVTVSDTIQGTMRFAILEYAGIAASSPLDVTAAAQGSGTNPSSGSVATTAGGDLLLGAVATSGSPGFGAGGGYTIEESVPAAPGTTLIAEDAVQTSAGSAVLTATLSASDSWAAALAAFRPAQAPLNSPPTLAQPANQTSAENSSVSLQLVGSDPDGDTLTYSATGLPASLSLDAATGLISGTLPFGSAGTYAVTATVSDGSQTSSKSFTWTVTSANQGPNITSLSRTAGPVGTPLTISGANFGATQGTSTVTFNGTAATPTSWSTTSIAVPVPSGAATGPVVVTVNSEASNGVSFTVTAATSAITLTQHGDIDAGTTTTASLTFGAANTAGNFIAIAIRAGRPNQTFTVTDSDGNSYQKAIEINGSNDTLALYYAENIAGGANTVTVSDTIQGAMRFAILEYAGIAASSPLDVTAAAQGRGKNPSSGSVATTANGDLLLGAVATSYSSGFGAGGGYTIEESVPAAPGTWLIAEDAVQAAAGSAVLTATLSASDRWAAALAAFRPAQEP